MLIKQEFKIDLLNLKNARHPDEVLASNMDRRAEELGHEIVKLFPYKKDEERSYRGDLPEMSLNKEHEFVDTYMQRLIVFSEEEFRTMIKQLESEAEELIQERDNEDEAYLRLAKANILKFLLDK